MQKLHPKEEILLVMGTVDYATLATISGVNIRSRMMHYWNDENFNVYLATMKGDPKILQITEVSSASLLVLKCGTDINDSCDVEITGSASFVKSEEEKDIAFKALAGKSPMVRHLKDTNTLKCVGLH